MQRKTSVELRREGDAVVPAGPKARRTRARLILAARDLFIQNGYSNTSVAHITEEAGVSLGTFYQYFRDRKEVVVALLTKNLESLFDGANVEWRARDGREGVHRMIGRFVRNYASAGETVRVWEEVSYFDAEVAELRRVLGRDLTSALQKELIRAGKAGLCRKFTRPEAEVAAQALGAMIDRFCYVSFVFDPPEGGVDVEFVIDVLVDLWASAISLNEPSLR